MRKFLKSIRRDADNYFKIIFDDDKHASKIDIDIKIPRVCIKQNERARIVVINLEDYYKINIFILFLDQIISELRTRFDEDSKRLQ